MRARRVRGRLREPRARTERPTRSRTTRSALQVGEHRLRTRQAWLVLDRALQHLDRLGFVALLHADLAEIVEDLALRDPALRIEALEKERAEGLLRAIEIVAFER